MRKTNSKKTWFWALLLVGTLSAGSAVAQEPAEPPPEGAPPAAETPPPKRNIPPGFEPVSGKEAVAESVSAPLMVVLAYGAFFVLMFGYVIYVVRGQTALSNELKALDDKLKKAGGQ